MGIRTVPHVATRTIELMDTTLRDGEQTPNVAYAPSEKMQLARLLLREIKVDRIEIANARISEGEAEAVRGIMSWARKSRMAPRIEILAYVDGRASVDWIVANGGQAMNLLTKGSREHCEKQLRMTPERHFKEVGETIRYAGKHKLISNVYLEDWSSGVQNSFDYVFTAVENLIDLGVERIYLADTLGILSPSDTTRYVSLMTRTWPDVHFEFHAHNDYGLAAANSLAAVEAGAHGVHTSVNGMGERSGNTRLAEVVAAIHDHSDCRTRIRENRLIQVSEVVATFSGKIVADNAPVIGRDVFTQTAGIHADGDKKAGLYANRLVPRRFGRKRRYALGKMSGKASLDQNLKALGIKLLPENRNLVLKRIVELGDKKHVVTPEDLPLIIADVLKKPAEELVKIELYEIVTSKGDLPTASVTVRYRGEMVEAHSDGDGGYDAFMKALAKACRRFDLKIPRLVDYAVRIPPGGKTGALVETVITWRKSPRSQPYSTLGVDSDQLAAAVVATEKMLNLVAAAGLSGD
ncbi:MAG: alpha-isopropylmalate synthase regulatory domain-containing protein [Myxococcota bacterium]